MTATPENKMLAKLRIKFVALICGVAALILVVSFSYIAWSNNNQRIDAIYAEMDAAVESTLAKNPRAFEKQAEGALEKDLGRWSTSDSYEALPPRIGDKQQASWAFPIAVYLVSTTAQVGVLTSDSTAVVDESALDSALSHVLESNSERGFLENEGLYFRHAVQMDGSSIVAFADETVVEDGTKLAESLTLVGAATLILVFILAWLFSRWVLRPVQRAWDSQQQFIADASHEMKTPLTVITANASIALKNPQSTIAEQSQWIEGIQDEAQNMEQLVLDMLSLAQPENIPGKDSAFEAVNLSELVERASLQFEAVAFERGITLEDKVEPHVTMTGDATQLQRLVGTLIDNACKYAAEGTAIVVSLESAGHNSILTVHNWGDPIPADDVPHVFDRFYRSDKSRDRSGDDGSHSFGLGLAIAQKITQQHGGTLSVSSSEAEGTTFAARLPRA